MSDKGSPKNTPRNDLSHVFIDQRPESFVAGRSRLVSSQARRFQSAGKRRHQRDSARKDAVYARSLVGWESKSSTPTNEGQRRLSPAKKTAEREQEQAPRESNQEQLGLAVRTGLRIDPFNAFPSSNSKTVMFMVDYHIHVWSPHKAGNFDALMGYNTQLDLCWPIAMQDNMLFDATIAVSRVAWVLSQGNSPSEDGFMLYHRGLAMTRLRQRVSVAATLSREAVIFTIGRMISIAYMSGEPEAFLAHFEAFRAIAERYIDEHRGTDCARVIQNRLDSWKALHEYRIGYDRLRPRPAAELPQNRLARRASPSTRLLPPTSQPQPAFLELNMSEDLSNLTNALNAVLMQVKTSQIQSPQRARLASEVAECSRQFGRVSTSQDLTPTHSQFCSALVAFCLQLHHLLAGGGQQSGKTNLPDFDSLPALEDIAATFLNKKLEGLTESAGRGKVLAWSALVLGSLLLQQPAHRLRTKGHIIHVSLDLSLGLGHSGNQGPADDDKTNGWERLESELGSDQANMESLWHQDLTGQWRRDWEGSMRRQRRWERQGLWKIGAPKRPAGVGTRSPRGKGKAVVADSDEDMDVIEYMVLREARDSLPIVE